MENVTQILALTQSQDELNGAESFLRSEQVFS